MDNVLRSHCVLPLVAVAASPMLTNHLSGSFGIISPTPCLRAPSSRLSEL
ncbi:unknown [Bacteroides sp. CAG:754]|nr:unknown [Bacteroides sp. CAG:754]